MKINSQQLATKEAMNEVSTEYDQKVSSLTEGNE
jgi:hypothetical protein